MTAGTTSEAGGGSRLTGERWTDPLFPGLQAEGWGGSAPWHCKSCDVRWNGPDTCWICGEVPEPLRVLHFVPRVR